MIFLFLIRITLLLLGPLVCLFPAPVSAATELDISPMYRQDNLMWNKAGENGFPNILSELKWENLRIQGFKGVLTHDLGPKYFLEATGSWGWIYAGANQDSDYDGNNRSLEFSRSNNNGSGGTVFDASLAVGWKLRNTKTTQTRLLLGYAINRQSLWVTEGNQTIDTDGNNLGPIPGLNTAYMAVWRGPWLGITQNTKLSKRLQLATRLEYHLPDYNGEAHWNLRQSLDHPVTNNHWAKGQGIVASLGLDYVTGPRWKLGAGVDYTNYWISPGTDQVNIMGGQHVQIQLNEVRWDSWAFRLKATYLF